MWLSFSLTFVLALALFLSRSCWLSLKPFVEKGLDDDRKWRYPPFTFPGPSSLAATNPIHCFSSAPAWPPVPVCTIIGSLSAHCCVCDIDSTLLRCLCV
uniref:Putative secreted protein n=1 Tax=Anopheles darlingi TaxID=43151 RepID=A0A2M4DI31_ANODA